MAADQSSGMASEHLRAELAERKLSPFKAMMAVFGTVIVGDVTGAPFSDLVIRRRDNGREVIRTVADTGDPDFLLHEVQADLDSMTVEEFLDEWRIRTDPHADRRPETPGEH